MKKTWQEKMEDKASMPKILKLEKKFPCFNATHKMGTEVGDKIILVNPKEIWDIMSKIYKGKIATIIEVSKAVAKKHKVKGSCTLTNGIFTMTAANACEEMKTEGKKCTLSWWRTTKAEGFLNDKYPGGQKNHKKLLQKEGFEIISRGKKYQVKDWEKYIINI